MKSTTTPDRDVGSSDSSAIRARLQQDAETARFVTTAVHYYGEDKEQLAADIEWALARIEYLEGRKQWWMKNAEGLTAERNELMNAGDNHAAVAARMLLNGW